MVMEDELRTRNGGLDLAELDRRVSTLERLQVAHERWSHERSNDINKMDEALERLQEQMIKSLSYIKGAMRTMVATGTMGAMLLALALWVFNEKDSQLKELTRSSIELTISVSRLSEAIRVVLDTNERQDKANQQQDQQLDYLIKHLHRPRSSE